MMQNGRGGLMRKKHRGGDIFRGALDCACLHGERWSAGEFEASADLDYYIEQFPPKVHVSFILHKIQSSISAYARVFVSCYVSIKPPPPNEITRERKGEKSLKGKFVLPFLVPFVFYPTRLPSILEILLQPFKKFKC